MDRDALGRLVRKTWVLWAYEQLDPKPSWLMPYDALTEPEKEVDRRIGEAIWNEVRGEIVGIISKRANAVYHTGWKEHPSNTLDDLVRVLVCGDDDPDPFDGERRRRS